MSRDDIIRPLLAKYASNLPLHKTPPFDLVIQKKLNSRLPDVYWKLALLSLSFLHEFECNKRVLKLMMALFEAYGKSSLDWCQRKYAVVAKRSRDPKRITHFANVKSELYKLLYDDWKLESYTLLGGSVYGVEPALISSSVERVLGAISIYFGPDSLVNILESAFNGIYREQEKSELGKFRDLKSLLQEETQRRFYKLPEYQIVGESGPDHAKEFLCRVSVPGQSATASGASKKLAEKAAAAAMLSQLGSTIPLRHTVKIESGSFDLKNHHIPAQQLGNLTKAEAFLKYPFRRRELLSSALIHKSFVHEVKEEGSHNILSYDPLAAVGSTAVRLLALDYCLTSIHNLIIDDIERSIQFFEAELPVRTDDLASTATAAFMCPLLAVGRGQKDSITSQMRSDVVQAVLAALLIDCDEKGWCEKLLLSQVIVNDICGRINFKGVATVSLVNPKGFLQEVSQAARWGINYKLTAEKGADHDLRFKSELILSIGSTNFKFVGGFATGRRKSENKAASLAIRYLMTLDPLSTRNGGTFDKNVVVKRFGSGVLRSIVELLNQGPAGWKSAIKLNLLGLSAVCKEGSLTVSDYFIHFHDLVQRLECGDVLDAFADSLSTAPVRRTSLISSLSPKLEHWISMISTFQPDNLNITTTSELTRGIQLVLAAINYETRKSDSSRKVADLITVLNMLGHIVSGEAHSLDDQVTTEIIDLLAVVAGFVRDEADCPVSFAMHKIGSDIILEADVKSLPESKTQLLINILRDSNIATEFKLSTISIYIPINSTDTLTWGRKALRNLNRTNIADREQLKYASQLLHDAKNMIIAVETCAKLSRTDLSKRFAHYAAAERAINQAKSLLVEAQFVIKSISELTITRFSFRAFLTDIVADIIRQSPATIALSSYLDRADVDFEGDENALRSAIRNMVKNGIKASGPTGDLRIESIYDPESNVILIEVTNSGEPVPEHVINAVNNNILPRSSTHEGYGLGIASIVHVARAHNGSFLLRNRNGRAVATLEIPTAPGFPRAITDHVEIDGEDLD